MACVAVEEPLEDKDFLAPVIARVGDKVSELWQRGEKLGSGRYGTVFKCLDTVTGSLFAVKDIPLGNMAGKTDRVQLLMREVEVMSHLNHPNIIRYYGADVQDGNLSIFLEYVSGGTLEKRVAEFGPLNERVIRVYLRHLLEGVLYLHNQGVVHRDIKPGNILVDVDGTLKLADFGCSEILSEITDSKGRNVLGTPAYMAPEVVQRKDRGCSSDIWSLGCTVLEIATGKSPWPKGFAVETILFQLRKGCTPPVHVHENLSSSIRDFIQKCLCINAEERATPAQLLCHCFVSLASPLNSPETSPRTVMNDAASTTTTTRKRKGVDDNESVFLKNVSTVDALEAVSEEEEDFVMERYPQQQQQLTPAFALWYSCGHYDCLCVDGITPEEAAAIGHRHTDGTPTGRLLCYGPFEACAAFYKQVPSCTSKTALLPVRNLFLWTYQSSSFEALGKRLAAINRNYSHSDIKRTRAMIKSALPSPPRSPLLSSLSPEPLLPTLLSSSSSSSASSGTSSPPMLASPIHYPSLAEPINHEWFKHSLDSSASVKVLAERILAGTVQTFSRNLDSRASSPTLVQCTNPNGHRRAQCLSDSIWSSLLSWTQGNGAGAVLVLFGFAMWHCERRNASSPQSDKSEPIILGAKPYQKSRFAKWFPQRCLYLLARRRFGWN